MTLQPVLLAGEWRPSDSSGTFHAENPATQERLPNDYPISTWADCELALAAADKAAAELRALPAERIAAFLEAFGAD